MDNIPGAGYPGFRHKYGVFILRSLIFLSLLLTACSAYQSDGRKFLERNLGSIGVKVQANVQGCGADFEKDAGWMLLQQTDQAQVFAMEDESYALLVKTPAAFQCRFQFASAQELYEKTEAAIAYTLTETTAPKASDNH